MVIRNQSLRIGTIEKIAETIQSSKPPRKKETTMADILHRIGATATKPIIDDYRARKAGATPVATGAGLEGGY